MILKYRRIVIILLVLGFGLQGILQNVIDEDLSDRQDFEFMVLPDGKLLKFAALGFNSLAADIYWIKTVLYFGDRAVEDDYPFLNPDFDEQNYSAYNINEWENKMPLFNNLLHLVTDLDPHFYFPYEFGGLFLSMKNGEIDNALAILDKGRKIYPDKYNLPLLKGFNYLFYKNDNPAALNEFLQAVQLPDCPVFVTNLIRGISSNISKTDIALEFLNGALETTTKEEIKEELEKIIKELEENSS